MRKALQAWGDAISGVRCVAFRSATSVQMYCRAGPPVA